jgi:predicted nucleotidyltransferase
MSAKGLADALFPRTRRDVLKELSANQEGLHLRELERRVSVNSRHLLRELHSLRDAGILIATEVGNQIIYRLNPGCPIYEELRSIVRKTVGLAATLHELLRPLRSRIELAYIYGSYASGRERSHSDVDLMVVGDATLRELSPILTDAQHTIQREISPVLYPCSEYHEQLRDDTSFVRRVHDGPRINVIGGPDES